MIQACNRDSLFFATIPPAHHMAGRSGKFPKHHDRKSSTQKYGLTRLQNRRAEWLAFRFFSFYFAADRLWRTLDFQFDIYARPVNCNH
jgi:hypothetical protein